MERWHSQREQTIMFRRWREEMDKHGYDWRCPPSGKDVCHCAQGVGSMRKRTPLGHHKHCLLCNWEKYLLRGRRNRLKREAIEFELSSY